MSPAASTPDPAATPVTGWETWVVLALGSNLGDSPALLRAGLERIQERAGRSVVASSLWTSTPVDCPPGSPLFVNAVAMFPSRQGESPEAWLAWMQETEKAFGRLPKRVMNEARPLDLDLIAYGREQRNTPVLTLPHPRAHQRLFVLYPLAEIAPDYQLPGMTASVSELSRALPADPDLRPL